MTRSVVFLLYDGFAATDAVGPADVFSTANQVARRPAYRLRYVSRSRRARASNGMVFASEALASMHTKNVHTLVIPGADEAPLRAALADRGLVDWIGKAARAVERVCSVCSGAFLLARSGVLAGKRATTHWRGLDRLRDWHDDVRIDAAALYVEDGNVWTSAGVTAGVDMALAIVERDLGRDVAMAIAREMVLFLVRPGGQPQFSAPLDLQARARDSDLRALAPWLASRLDHAISIADMARAVAMSERTFHRRCSVVFGMTPLAVLQRLRLERVRAMLADGTTPLKTIAAHCGFVSVSRMGKALRAQFGVTPLEYRRNFGEAVKPAATRRAAPPSPAPRNRPDSHRPRSPGSDRRRPAR